ncbi:hypothetical protein GRJ2_001408900 [Grus japonensis]|uniref:Uncharacterized protein n=1 Tax=Grus japonensis TaxID=30415 RepID=A0ABC9WVW4_GRUJA
MLRPSSPGREQLRCRQGCARWLRTRDLQMRKKNKPERTSVSERTFGGWRSSAAMRPEVVMAFSPAAARKYF